MSSLREIDGVREMKVNKRWWRGRPARCLPERPSPAPASLRGHLGHDGARAGCPCHSGRDARVTSEAPIDGANDGAHVDGENGQC